MSKIIQYLITSNVKKCISTQIVCMGMCVGFYGFM